MKEKFSIGGMSCSACSNGIEKAVSKIDGVKIANVSLLQKSMTVEFDEQKTNAQNIIYAVERLGYSASIFGQDEKTKPNKTLRIFCLSLIFLLPLLYFSMGGMIGLPLPNRKLNYAIQCVLALIVIILNKRFYVNGVRAVINLSPNMDTLVALGSFSAFSYSLVESILLWTGVGVVHVFFEASAMVLVLVTLGKWLEEKSKDKTGKEIEKLSKLIPKTVKVIRDGKEIKKITQETDKALYTKLEEVLNNEEQDVVCVFQSSNKIEAIKENSYLLNCYNKLSSLSGNMVIIGSSLDDITEKYIDLYYELLSK
jgi:Cu+-exporting ATPase